MGILRMTMMLNHGILWVQMDAPCSDTDASDAHASIDCRATPKAQRVVLRRMTVSNIPLSPTAPAGVRNRMNFRQLVQLWFSFGTVPAIV